MRPNSSLSDPTLSQAQVRTLCLVTFPRSYLVTSIDAVEGVRTIAALQTRCNVAGTANKRFAYRQRSNDSNNAMAGAINQSLGAP